MTAVFADTAYYIALVNPRDEYCTSFLVMEANGLTEALTSDHHFAQAGFKVLLARG
jgi:hypothetical protein